MMSFPELFPDFFHGVPVRIFVTQRPSRETQSSCGHLVPQVAHRYHHKPRCFNDLVSGVPSDWTKESWRKTTNLQCSQHTSKYACRHVFKRTQDIRLLTSSSVLKWKTPQNNMVSKCFESMYVVLVCPMIFPWFSHDFPTFLENSWHMAPGLPHASDIQWEALWRCGLGTNPWPRGSSPL